MGCWISTFKKSDSKANYRLDHLDHLNHLDQSDQSDHSNQLEKETIGSGLGPVLTAEERNEIFAASRRQFEIDHGLGYSQVTVASTST